MNEVKILWADDEIDLLRPHVLFLEQKGYHVTTVNNGGEAADLVDSEFFDIVFLDENMPGLSGLETLQRIKKIDHTVPVVMITKSEEESIMEEAIGSKIADYLIKPVNPNQILMSLKKSLDAKRIRSEKTTSGYQQQFREISMQLMDRMDFGQWSELYKKLIFWGLELQASDDEAMSEIYKTQKAEANFQFARYISQNYLHWLNQPEDAPLMSHRLFPDRIIPFMKNAVKPVLVLVIDNLRYDQWKVLQPRISEYYRVETEEVFCSILPTATHYARNAIFAGMLPSEISKKFPRLWKDEEDEGGKNMHEADFLEDQLRRLRQDGKWSYNKITNLNAGKKLAENYHELSNNKLNVIVYNFVDMLSHARTDMEVIKELADDDAAYRSLTQSWFDHSPLLDILKQASESGHELVITTDHGTIRVESPVKIVGDRNTNSNLRYKTGKNLNYTAKDVFEVKNPDEAFLPKSHVSSSFVFAMQDSYFVYPNNYNHFVNFYRNTFQHGGVSLEEMLIPFVTLQPK
ncbi:MAG: CheY-like chemotaxis protein [Flavobacteriales bacterium]|jgi:CheY-like chemotaxis protein